MVFSSHAASLVLLVTCCGADVACNLNPGEHVSLLQTRVQRVNIRTSGQSSESSEDQALDSSALDEESLHPRHVRLEKEAAEGEEQPVPQVSGLMDQEAVQHLVDIMSKNGTNPDPELRITQTVVVNQPAADKADQHGPTAEDKARFLLQKQWEQVVAADKPQQTKWASWMHTMRTDQSLQQQGGAPAHHARHPLTLPPSQLASHIMTLSLNASSQDVLNNGDMSGTLDGFDDELAAVVKDAEEAELNVETLIASGSLPRHPMPPIAFVKTHRTGGSALASIIHRIGDKRDLSFVLPAGEKHGLGWPAAFPGEEAVAFNSAPAHEYDVICNNAVLNEARMRQYLKTHPEPLFFTILRRPIAQVASSFDTYHHPAGEDWEMRIEWLEKMWFMNDKLDAAQKGPVLEAYFQNPQAHDLGWYERVGGVQTYDFDDIAIQKWITEVEKSLGFVLLTEYINEGLVLLHEKLGLEMSDLAYVQLKPKANHLEPTEAQATKLRELYRVDMTLYDHFSKAFWKQWKMAGGYAKFQPKLQQLKLRNEALALACKENDVVMCTPQIQADSVEFTNYLKKKAVQRMVATSYNYDDDLILEERGDADDV